MPPRRFRGLGKPLAFLVGLQIALGWLLASLYLSSSHTLYNNGHWTSTKTTLAEGVLGAYSFLFDRQPLATGSLDLGAWHGYQEVVSKAEFDPVEIEFDFTLSGKSYLTFEFNRTQRDYAGIRISSAPKFPPAMVEVTRQGEFLSKTSFRNPWRAKARTRHRLRIELRRSGVVVFLDGRRRQRFDVSTIGPQRIGFRAGKNPVHIDNVRVVSRDGSVFVETFERPGNWSLVTGVAVSCVLAVSAGLFLLLAHSRPGRDKILSYYFLMFTGLLVVVAAILHVFASYQRHLYPDESKFLRLQQEYWQDNQTERIFARIEAQYPRQPALGVHRVLFVGSSQTRGSGAELDRETLVRQTERILNERSSAERFECINTAIHGYRAEQMERDFRQRWIDWNPTTVVINATNNDLGYGLAPFRRRLSEIVTLAREKGIQVVLVMEPNSIERDLSPRKYQAAMKEVGDRYGVPVVDMHTHLLEHYDDGFLWWDWVHLTSYGQQLFAEYLVEEMARSEIVEIDESDESVDEPDLLFADS